MSKASEEQIQAMIDMIYEKYDSDNSGSLDLEEIERLMNDIYTKLGKSQRASDQEIRFFIRSIDQNGDGLIQKN